MATPLAKYRVFGKELPFESAATGVREGEGIALVVPNHEGVEVRGGPDAKKGEASVWVSGGKTARSEFEWLKLVPISGVEERERRGDGVGDVPYLDRTCQVRQ